MRKFCFFLCCVLIVAQFAGCSHNDDEIQQPVNLYYINKEISYNSPEGVICYEIREGAQLHNLFDLLCAYLDGPVSSHLQSFISNGVTVQSCFVENDTAYIHFSSQFSELSGIKLITACSALLLTAHDYCDVQSVCIQAESSKLDDKDEFILSLDEIVLMDLVTSEEQKE